MFLQQFFLKGIAHSSYLLGGNSSCAIIDPRRDIDIYLQAADEMGMRITHILETHLHADFISGHLELADVTGAVIYAPQAGGGRFPHQPVAGGDVFGIDGLRIRVLDTPGHTPEHISYVVEDTVRGNDATAVFCGDTLFVGDVGRPDLFPGKAEELAAQLFQSLHEQLLTLPDYCEVYPAHGAGSLCGRSMGAKRSSTIGYERRNNPALQHASPEEFARQLTHEMPPAPDHFSRCSAINRDAPALLRTLSAPAPLAAEEFRNLSEHTETLLLDLRGYESFGGMHISGAYNIDLTGNFATFSGWILPPDRPILLISNHTGEAAEAAAWLHRVGHDQLIGFLAGGLPTWARAGYPLTYVTQISVHALYQRMHNGDPLTLLDVRTDIEYAASHIDGAINVPVEDLRTRYREFDPRKPTALICGSGQRSSMGASLLLQRGFTNLYNVSGGMTAYSASGYAPACPLCYAPHGPRWRQ